jgi:hypothetical protein
VIDMLGVGGQERLRVHMDVHSYATQILSPWGHTTQPPGRLPTMDYLGRLMRDTIATHRGTWYQYGQGSIILYIVSGGSRDYSYGVHSAMGWTIELPGTSFHPPASEIMPVAVETQLGLLALSEFYLPAAQIFLLDPPRTATAGQTTALTAGVENAQSGSAQLSWRLGTSGAFASQPLAHLGETYYRAELPPAACGTTIQYYITAQGASGAIAYYPPGGAADPLELTAYERQMRFSDDVEAPLP